MVWLTAKVRHDAKSNVRNQIEQQDAYLINRHPGVMNAVKLIFRNMEPPAVGP